MANSIIQLLKPKILEFSLIPLSLTSLFYLSQLYDSSGLPCIPHLFLEPQKKAKVLAFNSPSPPSTFLDILYRRAALYPPCFNLSFLYYTTLLFSVSHIINFTCLSNLFLWKRDQQTVVTGQIQPLACFCMGHKLRLGFTFLSSWKKSKTEYFRMQEDYMKFRFYHLYIKSGTKQCPFIYLLSVATFVNETKAELSSCYSDCMACRAENIYHIESFPVKVFQSLH